MGFVSVFPALRRFISVGLRVIPCSNLFLIDCRVIHANSSRSAYCGLVGIVDSNVGGFTLAGAIPSTC